MMDSLFRVLRGATPVVEPHGCECISAPIDVPPWHEGHCCFRSRDDICSEAVRRWMVGPASDASAKVQFRPDTGSCPGCGAAPAAFCASDCALVDRMDWRG